MLFQYILKLLKTKSDIINLLSLSEFTPFNKIIVDIVLFKKGIYYWFIIFNYGIKF